VKSEYCYRYARRLSPQDDSGCVCRVSLAKKRALRDKAVKGARTKRSATKAAGKTATGRKKVVASAVTQSRAMMRTVLRSFGACGGGGMG